MTNRENDNEKIVKPGNLNSQSDSSSVNNNQAENIEGVTANLEKNKNIETNRNEKKAIIWLIVIALILWYVSLFFIHNIIDRGQSFEPSLNIKVEPGTIVDYSNRILVKQNGETPFNELKELDMFKNYYFNDRAIIAPGVEGRYNFTVEDETDVNFVYSLSFLEENPYNVNMVYKIRVNNEYIVGDQNTWVRHEDFTKTGFPLKAHSRDLYTVEWRWEHTDYDTQIGTTEGAYYKMYIKVVATQVLGKY